MFKLSNCSHRVFVCVNVASLSKTENTVEDNSEPVFVILLPKQQ